MSRRRSWPLGPAATTGTLATERAWQILGLHRELLQRFEDVVVLAARTPIGGGRTAVADPGLRDELARRKSAIDVVGALTERVVNQVVETGAFGAEGSMIKLLYSEALQGFGYAVARAYAGHEGGLAGAGVTAAYVRADLDEVAAALSALTAGPHPLASTTAGVSAGPAIGDPPTWW
jgi:hypothetical protein